MAKPESSSGLYCFTNSKGARTVRVTARTSDGAWKKLQRTHEFFYNPDGWSLKKAGAAKAKEVKEAFSKELILVREINGLIAEADSILINSLI